MFIISYCSKILLVAWYKNVQRLYVCVSNWTVIEPKYLKHPTFLFSLHSGIESCKEAYNIFK